MVSATIDSARSGTIYRWCGNGRRKSRVMAVIKANAYGHGLVAVARALDSADAFAVARVDEGLTLRDAGIKTPTVLLEGVFDREQLDAAAAARTSSWWCTRQSRSNCCARRRRAPASKCGSSSTAA